MRARASRSDCRMVDVGFGCPRPGLAPIRVPDKPLPRTEDLSSAPPDVSPRLHFRSTLCLAFLMDLAVEAFVVFMVSTLTAGALPAAFNYLMDREWPAVVFLTL